MELISRNRAIEDQDFLSFLYSWQNVGNPAEDDPMLAGEYFDESLNEMRFFSQEELDKSRQKEIDDFKHLIDDKPKVDSTVFATLVIDTPDDSDEIEYVTDVLATLIELRSLKMIFIPLYKTNWFNDDEIKNHDPVTKIAYNKLKSFIGKDDYRDGILISSKSDLKKFLPLYFNLVTANYIAHGFFYSENLKTVFSYHYSGELWQYCLSKKGLKLIEDFVRSNSLIVNKKYTTYNGV